MGRRSSVVVQLLLSIRAEKLLLLKHIKGRRSQSQGEVVASDRTGDSQMATSVVLVVSMWRVKCIIMLYLLGLIYILFLFY